MKIVERKNYNGSDVAALAQGTEASLHLRRTGCLSGLGVLSLGGDCGVTYRQTADEGGASSWVGTGVPRRSRTAQRQAERAAQVQATAEGTVLCDGPVARPADFARLSLN